MKCPYCGSELEDDAQFCTACGRSLSGDAKTPDSADPNLIPSIGKAQPFETIKGADTDTGKGDLSEQVNQIRSRTRRRMPLLLLVVLVALGVAATAFAATLLWRYVIAPALGQRQGEGIEAVGGAGNGGNSAGGAASTSGAATTSAATSPATPALSPVSPVTPATPEDVAVAGGAVAGDNGSAGSNGAAAGNAAGNGGVTGNGGNRNNGNGGTTQTNGTAGNGNPAASPTSPANPQNPGNPAVSPTSPASPTSPQNPNNQQPTTPQQPSTPQQPTTPSNPDNALQAAYDTLLSQYRTAQENGWKTGANDSADLQSLGSYLTSTASNVPADSVVSYAYTDLGNDGIKDLVIGGVTPAGTYDVYGIYSGNGSTPVSVMKGDLGARSWWQVLSDGTLAHFGEGGNGAGITERLGIKDGKLTTTDAFGTDVDSSGNKYFYQGSTDNHITEDAYNALKDALPGKAQLDWKPLSDVTVPSTPETPATPSTPTTPETPAAPSTPETPSTPTTPETPATPSTPETPSTPTTPSTPETPSTPDTPTVDPDAPQKAVFNGILSQLKAAQDRGWTENATDNADVKAVSSYVRKRQGYTNNKPKIHYAYTDLGNDGILDLVIADTSLGPNGWSVNPWYVAIFTSDGKNATSLMKGDAVNDKNSWWLLLKNGVLNVHVGSDPSSQENAPTLWGVKNGVPFKKESYEINWDEVSLAGKWQSLDNYVPVSTTPSTPEIPSTPNTPSKDPAIRQQAVFNNILVKYRNAQNRIWSVNEGDPGSLRSLCSYLSTGLKWYELNSTASYAYTDLGNDGILDLVIGFVNDSGKSAIYGIYSSDGKNASDLNVINGSEFQAWTNNGEPGWTVLQDGSVLNTQGGYTPSDGINVSYGININYTHVNVSDGALSVVDKFGYTQTEPSSEGTTKISYYQDDPSKSITEAQFNSLKDSVSKKAELDWRPIRDFKPVY